MAAQKSTKRDISKKLHDADKSLTEDQLESVSFLCAAAASVRKLYGESIKLKPSIPDCYSALRESRESQQNASCLLLFALSFVGCNQQLVDDLRQLMLGSQDPGPDVHGLLSDTVRQNLYFRELLHDVKEMMTGKDISAFIYLSSCDLKPEYSSRHTSSLLVHFTILMEQNLIMPSTLDHLYQVLRIMKKQNTMDMIDAYSRKLEIQVAKPSDIETYSLSSENVRNSVSEVVAERQVSQGSSCVTSDTGMLPATDTSSLSSNEDTISMKPQAESKKRHDSTDETLVGERPLLEPNRNLSAATKQRAERSVLSGPVCADRAKREDTDTNSLSLFPPVAKKVELKIIKTCRFMDDKAYVEWTSECLKYKVSIQDDDGEINEYEVSSKEFVITKLCPKKLYSIRVSTLSERGECTDTVMAFIPKPSKQSDWLKCCWRHHLPRVCLTILLLILAAAFGSSLVVYNLSTLQMRKVEREIQGNVTFAIYTVDISQYEHISITPEDSSNALEIYTGEGDCNRLEVDSRPYNIEWATNSSDMNTYEVTKGYFGHGSELIFQANITGYVDRFNCSATVYVFDNAESYNNFIKYCTIENFVAKICFNVTINNSGYNSPRSYMTRSSTYIYIGLFLPQNSIAKHADLRIYGTQHYYNRRNFENRCNISVNHPHCDIDLHSHVILHRKTLCILTHWEDSSATKQNVTMWLSSTFPLNQVNVSLVVSGIVSIFIIIPVLLISLCLCQYSNCCHRFCS